MVLKNKYSFTSIDLDKHFDYYSKSVQMLSAKALPTSLFILSIVWLCQQLAIARHFYGLVHRSSCKYDSVNVFVSLMTFDLLLLSLVWRVHTVHIYIYTLAINNRGAERWYNVCTYDKGVTVNRIIPYLFWSQTFSRKAIWIYVAKSNIIYKDYILFTHTDSFSCQH